MGDARWEEAEDSSLYRRSRDTQRGSISQNYQSTPNSDLNFGAAIREYAEGFEPWLELPKRNLTQELETDHDVEFRDPIGGFEPAHFEDLASDTDSLRWEDFDHEANVLFNREREDLSVDNSVCSDSSASLNYLYEQLTTPLTVNDQILIKTIIKEMEKALKPKISYLQETARKYDLLKRLYNIPSIGDLASATQTVGHPVPQNGLNYTEMLEVISNAPSKGRKLNEMHESALFEDSSSISEGTPNTSGTSQEQEKAIQHNIAGKDEEMIRSFRDMGITLIHSAVARESPGSPPLSAKTVHKLPVSPDVDRKHDKSTQDPRAAPVLSGFHGFMDNAPESSIERGSSSFYLHKNCSFKAIRDVFDEEGAHVVTPSNSDDVDADNYLLQFCLSVSQCLESNPFLVIDGYRSCLEHDRYRRQTDERFVKDISPREAEAQLEQLGAPAVSQKMSSRVHQLINTFERSSQRSPQSGTVNTQGWTRMKEVPAYALQKVLRSVADNSRDHGEESYRKFLVTCHGEDAQFRARFRANYDRLVAQGLDPASASLQDDERFGQYSGASGGSKRGSIESKRQRLSGLFKAPAQRPTVSS